MVVLVSILEIVAFVLRLIFEGVDEAEAVQRAAAKYGVSPDKIRKHL